MLFEQLVNYAATILGEANQAVRNSREALRWLADPNMHGDDDAPDVGASQLDDEELEGLLHPGLLRREPVDDTSKATVRAFFRKELKKTGWRRRSIAHTLVANNTAPRPHARFMRVNSLRILQQMCHRNTCAATRDFKSSF